MNFRSEDADKVSVEELLLDVQSMRPDLTKRCLDLCNSEAYDQIIPATLQAYEKKLLFQSELRANPTYGINVVLSCSIAWLSAESQEWEKKRDLLFELLIYGIHMLNRIPLHSHAQGVLRQALKVSIKNPIQGDRGSIVLIHEIFAALGKLENHDNCTLVLKFIVHYLKQYSGDGCLMTLVQAPWKLISKLARTDFTIELEDAEFLIGEVITVTIEVLCRRGIRAADEHANALIGIFRALRALWKRAEKQPIRDVKENLPPLLTSHYEMVTLLSMILCRADNLSLVRVFADLTHSCCDMLLSQPSEFAACLNSFATRRSKLCRWLEDLNENVSQMLAQLVILLWRSRSLAARLQRSDFLQLLFHSLASDESPHLIQNPQIFDELLVGVLGVLVDSISVSESLFLAMENILLGNLFSRHPVARTFALDTWTALLLKSPTALKRRHCEALMNALNAFKNAIVSSTPLLWNSEKMRVRSILTLLTRRAWMASSDNTPMIREILHRPLLTACKPTAPLQSTHYWISILPHDKSLPFDSKLHHHLLTSTISLLESEPRKSFTKCFTHVLLALEATFVLQESSWQHSKTLFQQTQASLNKLTTSLLDHVPSIHGLLLDRLLKIAMCRNCVDLVKLVCKFSPLLLKTDSVGKLSISTAITNAFIGGNNSASIIHIEKQAAQCIESILKSGGEYWAVTTSTLMNMSACCSMSSTIDLLYQSYKQRIMPQAMLAKSSISTLQLKSLLATLRNRPFLLTDLTKTRRIIQETSYSTEDQQILELMYKANESLLELEKGLSKK